MSTNKFQYWPSDGQLGSTKFTMATNAEDWPSGDALVGNFVYSEGKLVDFVDTKALIANDSKTTTFPYDYVNIQLDKSLEGVMTFNGCAKPEYLIITYAESGNSGDTVTFKYKGCKTVDDIKAVDPNYLTNDIVDGIWSESLADLEDGINMFYDCTTITSFNGDLSSLINGKNMFMWCFTLTSFSSNLSNLTHSNDMFYCSGLFSFESDLSSLINGCDMFMGSVELSSFNSNLKSLTNGTYMFSGCKLNTSSVQNIANTINDVNDLVNGDSYWESDIYKTIHIGIGNSTPNAEETTAFNTIAARGWTVYVIGNGGDETQWNPTSLTPIDGEEQQTPIPFWAKPVPSDEEHAHYVDSEGNYYNILGGNFIYGDNLETYGMFTCEEDAAAQMRLTKIEK